MATLPWATMVTDSLADCSVVGGRLGKGIGGCIPLYGILVGGVGARPRDVLCEERGKKIPLKMVYQKAVPKNSQNVHF